MTHPEFDDQAIPQPDCLLCAVRQLTEGDPRTWTPREPGDSVTGVVLRTLSLSSRFSSQAAPAVDLWLRGYVRIRVTGHQVRLRTELIAASSEVGDRLTVRYLGQKITRVSSGAREHRRPYQDFQVEVTRGHH